MVCQTRRMHASSGATVLELMVAAVLVSTMISVAAPLIVRCNHLLRDTRQVQLACDEITDQLEQLVSMSPKDRSAALQSLTVSSEISHSLPQAVMNGKIVDDEWGQRIVIEMNWQRPGDPLPITLVRWLSTVPDPATKLDDQTVNDSTEDQS